MNRKQVALYAGACAAILGGILVGSHVESLWWSASRWTARDNVVPKTASDSHAPRFLPIGLPELAMPLATRPSHYDPAVRQAQAVSDVVTAEDAAIGTLLTAIRDEASEPRLQWPSPRQKTPIRVRSTNITAQFVIDSEFKLNTDPNPNPAKVEGNVLQLKKGKNTIVVSKPDQKDETFYVFTPDGSVTPPILTHYSEAKNKLSSPIGGPPQSVTLYDRDPYVRLEGQNRAEILAVLVRTNGNAQVLKPTAGPVDGPGSTWQAVFDLPLEPLAINDPDANAPAHLLVLNVRDSQHAFAVHRLAVLVRPLATGTELLISEVVPKGKQSQGTPTDGVWRVNSADIEVTVTSQPSNSLPAQVVIYREGRDEPLAFAPHSSPLKVAIRGIEPGRQQLYAQLEQGDQAVAGSRSPFQVVDLRSSGPRVLKVVPENFGTAPGVTGLTVYFSEENPLNGTDAIDENAYDLLGSGGSGVFDTGLTRRVLIARKDPSLPASGANVIFDSRRNSVTLMFAGVQPDIYQLRIRANEIFDLFGNRLEGEPGTPGSDFVIVLGKSTAREELTIEPSIRPGIAGPSGEFVRYPEFTPPRKSIDGFNPNDKVEARVVRLYYYRDAHRVAQIVNRKVRSYNRAGVDMQRQLADKARTEADQRTAARQQLERAAIVKAQKTRQAENEVRAAEQSMNQAVQELTTARRQNLAPDDPIVKSLDAAVRAFAAQADQARAQVEQLRNDEIAANEAALQAESAEKLSREEQFRREVAAAHADPDTYAPGVPRSIDPVEQVSISVIGEGLIHLRGPLKGINIIRTMIDQIDQPVGQVRISVHTVQINGEKEARMELVAKQIQQHIDHARFLTMQSSEMLRRAVVHVASRRAEEARGLFPGETQQDRDRRYLHAFFGQDFIAELEAMDSEFLRSGNKLLSFHSMDTTSLSSALNLLALAKNSTRQEIFQTFDQLIQADLPQAEMNYLEAGMSDCPPSGHQGKHKQPPPFCPLSQNAKFESLRGFFNAEVLHDDTMTPLQREFIRLAQIFKGRLITELEYKQRVRERALIEERIQSNYLVRLQDAANKEDKARQEVQDARQRLADEKKSVVQDLMQGLDTARGILINVNYADRAVQQGVRNYRNAKSEQERVQALRALINSVKDANRALSLFRFYEREKDRFHRIRTISESPLRPTGGDEHGRMMMKLNEAYVGGADAIGALSDDMAGIAESVRNSVAKIINDVEALLNELSAADAEIEGIVQRWQAIRVIIEGSLWTRPSQREPELLGADLELSKLYAILERVSAVIARLRIADLDVIAAREKASIATRPLDHKKFLDMLIDDLEEKYIELLDGTRAQTANVDNYLKRLTTALDDDFNTQFYFPTFRRVREASTLWDVQFGQTETTSILANNREFAKVDPSATMEFDLPARSILLAEALDGAQAIMNDVGALANDPTFLAMARSQMPGAPATPPAGTTSGFGVVRDVLPGLDSQTQEQILANNAGARPQLGSNLENLIPDPAIYKFETGTGFEIRPVVQPDGQAVVFHFNYMYTTNVREPVRADEKHLGRVKRHFIDTDVQLSNFELREVSRYNVALKAARTSRGVPLFEDIPVVGVLFRPLPSDQSSLQQNLIMAQATIFPTLFDLMGLRWAPAVADMDPLSVSNREFVVRGRNRVLENRVYDFASDQVDAFLRIPEANRRADLYRAQETVPFQHPNGYRGPGLDLRDSQLQEGYQPTRVYPQERFVPNQSPEGAPFRPGRDYGVPEGSRIEDYPLRDVVPAPRPAGPILDPQRER